MIDEFMTTQAGIDPSPNKRTKVTKAEMLLLTEIYYQQFREIFNSKDSSINIEDIFNMVPGSFQNQYLFMPIQMNQKLKDFDAPTTFGRTLLRTDTWYQLPTDQQTKELSKYRDVKLSEFFTLFDQKHIIQAMHEGAKAAFSCVVLKNQDKNIGLKFGGTEANPTITFDVSFDNNFTTQNFSLPIKQKPSSSNQKIEFDFDHPNFSADIEKYLKKYNPSNSQNASNNIKEIAVRVSDNMAAQLTEIFPEYFTKWKKPERQTQYSKFCDNPANLLLLEKHIPSSMKQEKPTLEEQQNMWGKWGVEQIEKARQAQKVEIDIIKPMELKAPEIQISIPSIPPVKQR